MGISRKLGLLFGSAHKKGYCLLVSASGRFSLKLITIEPWQLRYQTSTPLTGDSFALPFDATWEAQKLHLSRSFVEAQFRSQEWPRQNPLKRVLV